MIRDSKFEIRDKTDSRFDIRDSKSRISNFESRISEWEILLECAKDQLHPGRASEISALLAGDIDWPLLGEMARRHGMVALLHNCLHSHDCQDAVPADFPQSIMDRSRSNAVSLIRAGELSRICGLFEDQQITLVPIKGPVFGAFAYGDSCLRPFTDLDVLINKQDIARAMALLLADGYEPEFNLDHTRDGSYIRQECGYDLKNHRKHILLDLHWGIARNYASFGLSADEILKDLIPFEFQGRKIMIPSPESMLLILIVHNGGKHQWEQLLWILDVAQLISSCKALDWDKVIDLAAAKGMLRALNLGLYLAQELLSVELPESVSRRIQDDRTIRSVAAQISARLLAPAESTPTRLEHLKYSLNIRARAVDKIRYCFAQLVTSDHEDRDRFALPQALVPLYGILRLARWMNFGRG